MKRGKSSFVVDQDHTRGPCAAPSPHDQIEIIDGCADGKAGGPHAHITCRDQALGECLRFRDRSGEHFCFPSRANKIRIADAICVALILLQRVEDGLRVDFECAKGEWLHSPPQRFGFTYGDHRRERSIERLNTASVEASAKPTRPFPGKGCPSPLRIVRAVCHPLEPH